MSNPVIINGVALGASITVTDTTALSALDPNGLTVGTRVFELAGSGTWILTVSTAALSSSVKAVNGVTGWRWIKTSSTGVASVAAGTGITVDATDPANPIVTNSAPVDAGAVVTVGSNQTTVVIAPTVTGDTDGGYRITGRILYPTNSSSGIQFDLQPNGASTGCTSRTDTLGVGSAETSTLCLGVPVANGAGTFSFIAYLTSKSGVVRVFNSTGMRTEQSNRKTITSSGEFATTATVITSLSVTSSTLPSGILSGSYFYIQKLGGPG